jgi:hypothetical protein
MKRKKAKKPKHTGLDFAAMGLQGARMCMWENCHEMGLYPAPKSPQQSPEGRKPDDFFWFCMEHVRQYNVRWDYFRGMTDAQIRRFQEEAQLGHRPTWKMGVAGGKPKGKKTRQQELYEAVEKFAFLTEDFSYYPPEYPKEGKEALAVLELSYPVTMKDIKLRYRELVKRFHPDKNQGKKEAEERFKTINEAYHYLKNCGYFTA